MGNTRLTQIKIEDTSNAEIALNLDETTGTVAYDNTTNSNNGTLYNSPTRQFGKFGYCLSFTAASSQYVQVPDNATLDFISTESYSIECWFKSATKADQTIMAKNEDNGAIYPFRLEGPKATTGYLTFTISDGVASPSVTASVDYSDNTWHHVVCVRDHTNDLILIYVDGVLKNSTTDTTTLTLTNNEDFTVGTRAPLVGGSEKFFNGSIDEVRVYRRKLNATQVLEHYNADVSNYCVNWDFESTNGSTIGVLDSEFSRVALESVIVVFTGNTIRVWEGFTTAQDTYRFNGYIERIENELGYLKIIGKDKLSDMIRRNVNEVYLSSGPQAGKISAIALDLITTHSGLNADSTSVQDSGTTIIVEKFVCKNADPFERCKRLADIIGWQIYYRADTNLTYFEPKGYPLNANTLTVGTEIIESPKWKEDNSEMINDLYLSGSKILEFKTDLFNGTGAQTTFNLTKVPETVEVYVANGVNFNTTAPTAQYLKTGSIEGSSSSPDYVIDSQEKTITFSATAIPPAGTNNVAVIIGTPVPTPIHKEIDSSIALYGRYTKKITLEDIKSVNDAETRANNILTEFSIPFNFTELKVLRTDTYNLRVGQRIRIIDSFQDKDETLVVTKLTLRYPCINDLLQVGDKEIRMVEWQASVEEKIKRIQELQEENQDIILEIKELQDSLVVHRETVASISRDITGVDTIFALGNSLHGRLGTDKLGDTSGIIMSTDYAINFNNIWKEYFYTSDFEDSNNTTCTWDTTGHQATFTVGQILRTLGVAKYGSTFISATLTIDNSTNLTLQLSADGGANFENVTNGVVHNFTATGSEIQVKITATGNATITSMEVSY